MELFHLVGDKIGNNRDKGGREESSPYQLDEEGQ